MYRKIAIQAELIHLRQDYRHLHMHCVWHTLNDLVCLCQPKSKVGQAGHLPSQDHVLESIMIMMAVHVCMVL